MKHVTYADKSMLVGDEAAELIMEYAAAIIRAHTADIVNLKAIGSDGNAVEATFLLGEGAPLMAETASAQIEEPDNAEPIEYMRTRMRLLKSPPVVMAIEPSELDSFGDYEHARRSGN